MLPQSGRGGWMPAPRNDSPAPIDTTLAAFSAEMTRISEDRCGRMCRRSTAERRSPAAIAASTKTRVRRRSTSP